MASIRLTLLATILAVSLRQATAQGTNATCVTGYEWMTNSRGQSPCLQAAYLNSACLADPTDAYVYSLPVDYHYRPPTVAVATSCQCSTVFYSMISACGDCQIRENLPWSAWISNCSTVYTSIWPVTIPPGTSIPSWAFLDVVTPDAFNVTAAQAFALQNHQESSAAPPPTAQSTPPPAQSSNSWPSSALGIPEHTQSPDSSSSHKSNVGPIVGGVVGGIAGLAIIAGLIAWFLIRNKKQKAYATQGSDPTFTGHNEYTDKQPEPAAYYEAPSPAFSPPPHSTTPMAVYNPDDPNTFPGSHPSTSVASATAYSSSPPPTAPYQHTPGQYKGVAEV